MRVVVPLLQQDGMRVLALSDALVDYDDNTKWIHGLSQPDYCDDLLIIAGDVSHR